MTLDDSEFTVARGFPMNGQGRKMVTHPDTGKLVPYWGASDWPLDPPYTGPPDAGDKGTYVHNLIYWQLGAITADGLKAERERLGIPAEVAKHIAADWQRLADEHAIDVHHVEHPSVNDRYEIASPIDIVGTVDGQPAIIDIKTAGDYRKTSYACQMVYYTGSVRYVDGVRLPWFDNHDGLLEGWIAHYPLSQALKAHANGDPLPAWELHPVDVEAARPWADMLHTLRRIRPAVAFPGKADVIPVVVPSIASDATDNQIAAPDERTANVSPVEQPAGSVNPPPTDPALTPLQAASLAVTEQQDAARDRAKPLDNSKSYYLDRFGRPILPPAVDGDDADPAAVAVLKARYAALEGDGRLWVNAIAKGAQAAGAPLSLADSQPQTIRRFEAMRALVLLAEGGFADDGAVRGILRVILGDVADMPIFTIGKLVAALDQHAAARFAQLADTVANGTVDVKFTDDGRCHWGFAA